LTQTQTETETKTRTRSKKADNKANGESQEAKTDEKEKEFEELLKEGITQLMKVLGTYIQDKTGKELSESDLREIWNKMDKDKKQAFLFSSGLVPEPGVVGAITGWHDIQHLRSKGAGNKTAGIWGIATKSAAVALAVLAALGRIRWS
jgi:hypothetical protein